MHICRNQPSVHAEAEGGGGGGEGETRSGTEKRCSHNLQSRHPAWWSADNCSSFPRSELAEEMLQKLKKNNNAFLFFLHIVFVFRY